MSDQAVIIRKDDQVRVTAGPFAGRVGLVIQLFRGQATVCQDDRRTFVVEATVCAQTQAGEGQRIVIKRRVIMES